MTALILAILFTLGTSAFCSLLEAFILSVTTVDIESLKRRLPARGQELARFKDEMEETSSAILSLNTIANTLGATVVGVLAGRQFGQIEVGVITGLLIMGILFFAEIVPKNVGAMYTKALSSYLVRPLRWVRIVMSPITFITKRSVGLFIGSKPPKTPDEEEEEFLYLADKHAEEGALTRDERDMIQNALTLDNLSIGQIMTPRPVVTFVQGSETVSTVSQRFKQHIPFARIPVYEETIDHVVGFVRRRDILTAAINDRQTTTMLELMNDILIFREGMDAAAALKYLLKERQQLAVVSDEFGGTAGVLALEDIIEHLIGQEIFEDDDVAIDMRQLAKKKAQQKDANVVSNQVQPK